MPDPKQPRRPKTTEEILAEMEAMSSNVGSRAPEQPDAEPTDGLPAGAQSTQVTDLQNRFPSGRATPVLVVVERADGPLTPADDRSVG